MPFKKREVRCTKECTQTVEKPGNGNLITILKRTPGCDENVTGNVPIIPEKVLNSTPIVSNTTDSEYCSKTSRIFKPFHVRVKEYYEIRDRIFNDSPKPTRSALRMRSFWQKAKHFEKLFLCSILDRPCDVRPYAEVTLFDQNMLGLLDTGASISCIGSEAAQNFLSSGARYRKLKSSVRTADGKPQKVIGYVETSVTFRE